MRLFFFLLVLSHWKTHTISGTDWDVSILHYLGLDHVGHQLGPSHPMMSKKLDEMGHTFRRIHDNLLAQDKLSGKRTLLLLLSGEFGVRA